ncbi:MAG: GNAT family N-acetyltransferase [Muribaculaceae bacterium]|nr:GNAT family N-acetyltransferase [Muribaculaceae bacterium]
MTLSDGTITLRAPEPSDIDRLYIWENDMSLWPFGSAATPLSRHMLSEYIAAYDGDIFSSGQLRFVIELCGKGGAVGTIDMTHFEPRDRHARIGVFVEPASRRACIARRAIALVMAYARDVLGMHMLMALVADDNEPSRRLFATSGFNSCGRVRSYLRRGRSYHDIIIYQVLL